MTDFRSATLRTFFCNSRWSENVNPEELLIQKEGVVYEAGIPD